jgi:hypothetical protein
MCHLRALKIPKYFWECKGPGLCHAQEDLKGAKHSPIAS